MNEWEADIDVKMDYFSENDDSFNFGINDLFCTKEEHAIDFKKVAIPQLVRTELHEKVDDYIKSGKATNTKYKEIGALRRFKTFLIENNKENGKYTPDITKMSAPELDDSLCLFFMHARKFNAASGRFDGELYQPDSLSSFRNSFQRILDGNGSPFNLKNSSLFIRSIKVLSTRRKELTKLGLGNKPNATRALSDVEVLKLK